MPSKNGRKRCSRAQRPRRARMCGSSSMTANGGSRSRGCSSGRCRSNSRRQTSTPRAMTLPSRSRRSHMKGSSSIMTRHAKGVRSAWTEWGARGPRGPRDTRDRDRTHMPPATQQRPRPQQSRRRPRRWLSRLAWVLALAVLVVLLLPYLLVPLYRTVNPISTLMLWRWATGVRVERSFVPIDRMAPALPVTVIASEDGRFCSHRGIDWRELRERLEDVDDISAARAVSTITQQTAKNLFLWPGRSFVRKALELPLALWIDLVLPKRRVLEIYLN